MTLKQTSEQYQSFLVRLWREEGAETCVTWQGEVESIQSGQKWQFDNLESIISFLRTQILAASITGPAQKDPPAFQS